MSRVIVAGGGAAGMMAAYASAASGHQVILLEKNEKLGKKIYITGKGRCNVTNAVDREQFFRNIISNSKFLYSSIYQFDARAMMDFLEEYGCQVKTERGGRVFPVSDHASDVTGALQRALSKMYVEVRLHTEVKRLLLKESEESEGRQIAGVLLADGKKLEADAVILACGGLSYASTGSDGSGFELAAGAGHSLVPCRPALVPFVVKEQWCKRLQGLSLKNVEVKLFLEEKEQADLRGKSDAGVPAGNKRRLRSGPVYEGFGEMLFTHFGVSGPLILSASSYYGKAFGRGRALPAGAGQKKEDTAPEGGGLEQAKLILNLKPAMDEEMLDKRLLRDFEENSHKAFKNALGGLFPAKLIPVMVELSGIDGEKKVYDVTRKERLFLVKLIQNLPLTITGTRGFTEAIVTQGGIPVSEVNPSSMESRLCKGLYLAGEMLDIDALTGGYNLQLAWSTGHLAGTSVKF